MVEGIRDLATARRSRLWDTMRRLDDEELRARVEASARGSQRTIEEWHDFVESLDVALQAMRTTRHAARHRGGTAAAGPGDLRARKRVAS